MARASVGLPAAPGVSTTSSAATETRARWTTLDLIMIVLASGLFIGHAAVFGQWIIDDAGISFAYSRNLAQGYGLVSQPGAVPVEGYSNFTWVVLMVPVFWLKANVALATKVISVALVIAGFAVFQRTLTHFFRNPLTRGAVLVLLALTTPFVIWTTSGLENPLYFLLAILLFDVFINDLLSTENSTVRNAVVAGVLSALLAMTRPDGMLFLGLYPVTLLLLRFRHSQQLRDLKFMQPLLACLVAAGVIFGAFLLFRLAYFGQPLPNTYYAKNLNGDSFLLSSVLLLTGYDTKLLDLIGSAIYLWRFAVLLILLLGMTWLIARSKFTAQHLLLGLFIAWTAMIYVILPDDWMGEFRFGTLFYPFFYTLLLRLGNDLLRLIPARIEKRVSFALLTFLLVFSGIHFLQRSLIFSMSKPVPFEKISQRAELINQATKDLSIEQGSILTPDLGGTLMYSNLKVVDLAGLTDKTIAHSFYNRAPAQTRDYIFGYIKPTFIQIHGLWTSLWSLEEDERFRQDYEPVCEYAEKPAREGKDRFLYSGVFIRRELQSPQSPRWESVRQSLHDTYCDPYLTSDTSS